MVFSRSFRCMVVYLLLMVVVVDSMFLQSLKINKDNNPPFEERLFKKPMRKTSRNEVNSDEEENWDCDCQIKCSCFEKAKEKVDRMEDEATLLNTSCCEVDESLENEEDPFTFTNPIADVLKQFWRTSGRKRKEAKGVVESRMVQKKISAETVLNDSRKRCCSDSCLTLIPVHDIVEQRKRFWGKTKIERGNYLDSMIEQSELGREVRFGRAASEKRMIFKGVKMCVNAWCTAHGVSRSSFFERRQVLVETEGPSKPARSLPRRRRRSEEYEIARMWFRRFIKFADSMPNCDVKCLPSCLTKLSVYNIYCEQMKDQKKLSRTQFVYDMWKINFPNVYIPKQSRFTKCTICELLKQKMQNSRVSCEERKEFTLMRQVHITQQMAEREKYYKHGLKGKKDPDKYLSLIIDGMDQSKHNLPHFNVMTKADSTTSKLKTHVTGVLGNARSAALTFIDCCQWPHDSNLTINILLRTLLFFQTKLGKLPPTLYIQMDNCYRECKNKYVLAFLSILVKMGFFKKIKLSFLMVGHTHEDIDQMFSCFSRHLSKRDARTLPELMSEMTKAYTPEPSNILLDSMFDVKKWMDGYIEQQVSGHINQHQFKFINCKGEAVTFYKKWSTSQKWLPCSSPDKISGLILVHSLPTGIPEIITPNCEKIPLAKLKQDIGKLTAKFDKVTETWWENFLQDLESLTTRKETWFLEQMQKVEEDLLVPSDVTDEEMRIRNQIDTLMEKETAETEIVIRAPKNKRKATANTGQNTGRKKRKHTKK